MIESESFELEAQTVAELADAIASDKLCTAAWPRTLVELVDVLAATLVRRGMKEEPAEDQARHLVAAIALHHGGRPVYLPKGKTLETALLHDAIFRAHRRGNTDALARRHGLTTRAIQRIVRDQTLLHRSRVQPSLFPNATGGNPDPSRAVGAQ